ncbi:helix-turn-helix domain-containing protein [Microbacterium sp. CFH 90308]|uniref:Helix-turn-helix domain-containing protein n=1 Tax=Microbacterium salsuginis TaxID=2722803 RepID=A0ABX1K7H6_9MICO|nr:XRE family transcriptional regulator [Microbacterium sp. CFH 90308]NLP82640.1 helix-turn-helix domain-containing protein [Microbacterium sp. CFH 90308]
MPDLDTPWDLVGHRVRAARTAAGLTVRELARRIGVSASHVSQVERGLGAFSVPALYSVASELGVSMNDLLAPAVEAEAAVAPRAEGVTDLVAAGIVQRVADHPTIKLSSGPQWSRLTAVGESDAEFLEVVYAPHTRSPVEHIHHLGREYGVVIAGALNVEVDGASAVLEVGDSIVFDSQLPHRFWNEGDVEVRAVWFVRDRDAHDPLPHG